MNINLKIYSFKCNKYRKFKNPKISRIFNEALYLSIICSKCDNNNDTKFKQKESIKILNFQGYLLTKMTKSFKYF